MKKHIKKHWEHIYQTKSAHEVSWTQETPIGSLALIHICNLPKNARIMDAGGGDGLLVDHLLNEGFTQISVLDISDAAIEKAKRRLGARSRLVTWYVGDVLDFQSEENYDLWHDRATFHFQTNPDSINQYIKMVDKVVKGYLIIATFSDIGPTKCSGLEIQQYNESDLKSIFEEAEFMNITCHREDHVTPFGTKQNFLFCQFKKKSLSISGYF